MRGRLALGAEFAGGGDDAAPEMPAPDAVDDHAGGERLRVLEDGAGQIEPAAAIGELARLAILRGEGAEEPALYELAGLVRVPALHHLQVARFAGLVIE